MSGLSPTSSLASSSSSQSAVAGTNVPPVSFPGIASGIDYNSIIQKLTQADQIPINQYNTQITQITAKNSELIKINSLLASVQSALGALSQPAAFNSYTGTSTNPTTATATSLASAVATPGTYTIDATSLATSSVLLGTVSASIAHTLNDTITGNANPAYNGLPAHAVPLADAYTAVTPSNGPTGGQGKFTVDGVQVTYDVGSQSVDAILARIQSAVRSAGDSSFTATYNSSSDTVSFSSTQQQISIGSAGDTGNLAQVLKLDSAQINNGGPTNSVTSAGGIGGTNIGADLNGAYGANLRTAVTSGTFTINGVQIKVDATKDNISDVLQRIDASSAGVIANFDAQSGTFSLTNKQTGSQSIVVGGTAHGDTSNFLDATGLSAAGGSSTTVGKQASVTLEQPGGGARTYYSNSNSVQNAIAGMAINVGSTESGTPFTITVASDTTSAVSAINTFVSAYNGALNEINNALAAPVVQSKTAAQASPTSTTAQSSTLAGGGALYGDQQLETVRDQLINIVSGYVNNGSYSSLSTVGLNVSSSFSVLQANSSSSTSSSSSSTSGPITTQTYAGTDGTLQALDTTKFAAAFAANPQAVANLFTGSLGIVNQLGTFLTGVTGSPTSLATGLVGNIPSVSLLQGDENTNTDQVTSLQQYVKQLTDNMNTQADQLRSQFVTTESLVAQYQSQQSAISQLTQSFTTG